MTFADHRKAAFYGTILRSGMAETVTLRLVGQDERRVTVVGTDVAADQLAQDSDLNLETFTCSIGRDPSHALGGIDRPEQRMTIVRDGDQPGSGVWAFNGDVLETTPHSFMLKFLRPRLFRLGKR